MSSAAQTVIWSPQPGPQSHLISCPVFEVFYGGARGGGKTESSLGDWMDHAAKYGEAAVGVFFRRKFKQLEEVIARSKQLFSKLGAKYNEQKAEWTFPNGARLKFRYLEKDQDAQEYQGHSYTRVYVEEATNFPSPAPINLLRGTLRSAAGVPTGMRLTGNPGGPGHHWVKKRYIEPNPLGYEILKDSFDDMFGGKIVMERVFIPSKLTDNLLLLQNDPTYVAKLRQAGSEALVKAWLEGNWDLVDGAFFDCFNENRHVLATAEWLPRIPDYSLRFRSMDWGSRRPFSIGWQVVSDGTWGLPRDAVLRYREWYGCTGQPNEGLKLDVEMVAEGIREREKGEQIRFGRADPSIFVRNGGPSIAERMMIKAVSWTPADNKRIPGWQEVRVRLTGGDGSSWGKDPETGLPNPGFYVLDCCDDTIRTLPNLQHDPTDVEDLDTEQEDHAADDVRYALMGRPWTEFAPRQQGISFPKLPSQMTINEIVSQRTAARRAKENA